MIPYYIISASLLGGGGIIWVPENRSQIERDRCWWGMGWAGLAWPCYPISGYRLRCWVIW